MKNYSRQREEIIIVVKNMHNHPTAEEIYMVVKSHDPAVSRSTVYRNLGLLVENKIITKISTPVGPDRYDYNNKDFIHNHVICYKCGTIRDYVYDFKFDKFKKEVESQTGMIIAQKNIMLEGLCEECKKKNIEEVL